MKTSNPLYKTRYIPYHRDDTEFIPWYNSTKMADKYIYGRYRDDLIHKIYSLDIVRPVAEAVAAYIDTIPEAITIVPIECWDAQHNHRQIRVCVKETVYDNELNTRKRVTVINNLKLHELTEIVRNHLSH